MCVRGMYVHIMFVCVRLLCNIQSHNDAPWYVLDAQTQKFCLDSDFLGLSWKHLPRLNFIEI